MQSKAQTELLIEIRQAMADARFQVTTANRGFAGVQVCMGNCLMVYWKGQPSLEAQAIFMRYPTVNVQVFEASYSAYELQQAVTNLGFAKQFLWVFDIVQVSAKEDGSGITVYTYADSNSAQVANIAQALKQLTTIPTSVVYGSAYIELPNTENA